MLQQKTFSYYLYVYVNKGTKVVKLFEYILNNMLIKLKVESKKFIKSEDRSRRWRLIVGFDFLTAKFAKDFR